MNGYAARILKAGLLPALAVGVLFYGQVRAQQDAAAGGEREPATPGGVLEHGYSQIEGYELINPRPKLVPFGQGEYLLFAIQYGLINAGEATLEVRNYAEIGGRKSYRIVSEARTNKTFDVFYRVRDQHISFMDWEHLHSLRFDKHLREGRFRRDSRVEFDQENRVAIYPDREVGIPPNTQDFLSALYYIRTVPIEPGQALAMVNHTNGKNYPIFIKVIGRETVRVPAGEFSCIVIEPVLETTTIFENTGRLTIWLTDDTVRMPVLLRSKVIVGSFEAVLKEYALSGDAPRIIDRAEAPEKFMLEGVSGP